MSGFAPSRPTGVPVPAPEELAAAVQSLSDRSGYEFKLSDGVVEGTSNLYLVWTEAHPLPGRYSAQEGLLGFRVPGNFPDAAPEDHFFVTPSDLALREPDPVRGATTLYRANANNEMTKGVLNVPVVVFSWHIWDRDPWNRRKHTLFDHYTNALKRFEIPENGP